MYSCDDCKKTFGPEEGILAEVKDKKVIFNSCSPFTSLTCLCNECADKKGVNLLTDEQENRLEEWIMLYEKEFVSIHDVMSAVEQYNLDKSSVLRELKKRGVIK